MDELPLSLMDNTNLKYLDLQDNVLGNTFGENLFKVLNTNITIEDLELQGNNFINQGMKDQCLEEVRKNLLIKEYILQHLDSRTFKEQKIVQSTKDMKKMASEIFQSQIIIMNRASFYRRERDL